MKKISCGLGHDHIPRWDVVPPNWSHAPSLMSLPATQMSTSRPADPICHPDLRQ